MLIDVVLRVTSFVFLGSLAGLLLASPWSDTCPSAETGVDGELGRRTFYVDSETGRDSNDGQSPDRAWQSLDQVNSAEFRPGDTVRFKSGGVWRGSLAPASGDEDAPVTYTSFGQGPKPRILGSLPRSRTEDWVQVRENVWATLPMEYHPGDQLLDLRGSRWNHYQEAGSRIDVTHVEDTEGPFLRIVSESGVGPDPCTALGPHVVREEGQLPIAEVPCPQQQAVPLSRLRNLAWRFAVDAVRDIEPARPSGEHRLGHLSSRV